MKIKNTGRPANLKKIQKVRELRKKGLSFRDIAKLEESDVKTVFRWFNYGVGKNGNKVLDSVGKRA